MSHFCQRQLFAGRMCDPGDARTFGEQENRVSGLRARPFLAVWALAWEAAGFQALVLCEPSLPGGIIVPPCWQKKSSNAGQHG